MAFKNVKKGKVSINTKKKIHLYELNLGKNIFELHEKLKTKKFLYVDYNIFNIFDGKPRKIYAPSIESAIVQHAIYLHIRDFIDSKFIYQSYACRLNKGIQQSRNYIQKSFKKHSSEKYYIQLDIKKFFYSIEPEILLNILKVKYIKDDELLELIKIFLKLPDAEKGIPIGNVLSQIFANVYMNEVDKFIIKNYKHYARYMDDFIIIGLNLEEARKLKISIENFLKTNLNLELSKYHISKIKRGTNFAGYRIWQNKILLRKRHIKNVKKFIKNNNREGYLTILGLAKGTNSYKYIKNINNIKLGEKNEIL